MLIPVWVFNDNLHFRVHRFGRPDDQLPCRRRHQVQPVLSPGLIPFFFDRPVIFTIREEKIIEDEFRKVFRGVFSQFFYLFPVIGVAVAKGLKSVGFADGQGDAARYFHAPVAEEFLGDIQGLLVYNYKVAMRFKVDLIHFQLPGDLVPQRLQIITCIAHHLDLVGPAIHR